ncbi:MAG: YlxR family protein [Lachnospiraceae bacterium]|nr:YlxR family protein [Lachnospiraceae bacterium]
MKMNKKIPMRLCIGCGQSRPKKEMMRVVRTQEDTFVLDMTGKKNGRGAYLCKNEQCLKNAVRNKGLERSFKMSIPGEVYERLAEEFNNIETE